MLRQITILRFKPKAPLTLIDDITQGFINLKAVVPGICRFEHGINLALMDDEYHYALVIDFESKKAWRAYQNHPKHIAFANNFIDNIEKAVRVHYEVDC